MGRKVTMEYNHEAERALTRATLMRLGVPERVLEGTPPAKRTFGKIVVLHDP